MFTTPARRELPVTLLSIEQFDLYAVAKAKWNHEFMECVTTTTVARVGGSRK